MSITIFRGYRELPSADPNVMIFQAERGVDLLNKYKVRDCIARAEKKGVHLIELQYPSTTDARVISFLATFSFGHPVETGTEKRIYRCMQDHALEACPQLTGTAAATSAVAEILAELHPS